MRSYGILEQTSVTDDIDKAVESVRGVGYAVIDGGYDRGQVERFSESFERAQKEATRAHGGAERLRSIDEHNIIRLPLAYDGVFVELALNTRIVAICGRLIGDYFILNQQNGVTNPARTETYSQGAWHRDLPYQHVVLSRPIAVGALFCIDAFTNANGATRVLPASHRHEAFPSESYVETHAITVEAPAGSFIVIDSMLFHTGGQNTTEKARRGVNHVYTTPIIRQQIEIPSALGESFTADSKLRRVLGYDVQTPRSIADYLDMRRRKKS